jgi:hypothetical protein
MLVTLPKNVDEKKCQQPSEKCRREKMLATILKNVDEEFGQHSKNVDEKMSAILPKNVDEKMFAHFRKMLMKKNIDNSSKIKKVKTCEY